MAVTFDVKNTVDNFGVTGLVTTSFTIAATANRAAILAVLGVGTITNINGGCGGSTGTVLSGSQNSSVGLTVALIGVKAPNSGSTTSSASWTTSVSASLGVVVANGVDQTTPFSNSGTKSQLASSATMSQVVTSASGDLTCTMCSGGSVDNSYLTNQTLRNTDFACQDTGPGTTNPTHSWHSPTAQDLLASYGNFKQVSGGGSAQPQAWQFQLMGMNGIRL